MATKKKTTKKVEKKEKVVEIQESTLEKNEREENEEISKICDEEWNKSLEKLHEESEEEIEKRIDEIVIDQKKEKKKEKPPKTSSEKIQSELKDDTIVLVRENGILRVWDKRVIENIETWIYHQKDATWKYLLIDFDSTKVAPIAKGILNELSLFPELEEIRFNNILSYVLIFIWVVCVISIFWRVPSTSSIVQAIIDNEKAAKTSSQTTEIKKEEKSAESIFKTIEERQRNQALNKTSTWASEEK